MVTRAPIAAIWIFTAMWIPRRPRRGDATVGTGMHLTRCSLILARCADRDPRSWSSDGARGAAALERCGFDGCGCARSAALVSCRRLRTRAEDDEETDNSMGADHARELCNH